MPTYRYEAMTSPGKEVVDVIEAQDSKTARKRLTARGLFVKKLTKSAADSPDDSEPEPSPHVIGESTTPKRQPREPTGSVLLPCLIMGLAGIASLVFGLVLLSASVHLLFTGDRAVGIVTKLTPYRDTTGSQVRGLELPTVTFQSSDGPIDIHTSVASNRFRLGDKVPVLYPLRNPRAGQIFMVMDMFFPGALWSAGGLLGVGIAWGFGIRPALVKRRRRQPR